MWDDHWKETWFWEAGWGRNSKSSAWKWVVARVKTKFKMKIMRGKRKVKWNKRREGQSMWIEINYSIKSSDLICTNLMDQIWMLKSYTGTKISQIVEKTTVDFMSVASSIYHCFLFLDLPLVMSDLDPFWPQAVCSRLPETYYLWLSPSVVNLVTLHSVVRLRPHRAVQNPS